MKFWWSISPGTRHQRCVWCLQKGRIRTQKTWGSRIQEKNPQSLSSFFITKFSDYTKVPKSNWTWNPIPVPLSENISLERTLNLRNSPERSPETGTCKQDRLNGRWEELSSSNSQSRGCSKNSREDRTPMWLRGILARWVAVLKVPLIFLLLSCVCSIPDQFALS